MLFIVLVLIILQHTGSTTECPPKSGIFLMHKGMCITENAFLRVWDIQAMANGLHCLLVSSGSVVNNVQGQWLYPDGGSVNCSEEVNSNHQIGCSYGDQDDGIILYAFKQVEFLFVSYNGVYTCCMPGNCSDGNSDSIIVRIFDVRAITNLYVTLPEDVAVIPQTYTVHCVANETCDCAEVNTTFAYYILMEGIFTELATQTCEKIPSLLCSHQVNSSVKQIVDNQLIVTWEANDTLFLGDFFNVLSYTNGDHDFQCLAFYMGIENRLMDESTIVFVRAPNFSPSGLTSVSTSSTSLKISWVVPSLPPDADGYVIYYGAEGGSVSSVKVVGGDVSEYTLGGLLPGTNYSISIRAYQDILGPASDALLVTTNSSYHDILGPTSDALVVTTDTSYQDILGLTSDALIVTTDTSYQDILGPTSDALVTTDTSYQDILGPTSDALVVTTKTSEGGDGLVTPSPTPEMQQSFEIIGGGIAAVIISFILVTIAVAAIAMLRKWKCIPLHSKPTQAQNSPSTNEEDLKFSNILYKSSKPSTGELQKESEVYIYEEISDGHVHVSAAAKSQKKVIATYNPEAPVTIL